MNRVLLLCTVIGAILIPANPAIAATPAPNLKLTQELGAAHSIYVINDTVDDAFNAFIVSYVKAWGRYAYMPTPQGADLILRFNVEGSGLDVYLMMSAYDGNTLEKLAMVKEKLPSIIWTQNSLPSALAKSLDDLVKLAGPTQPRPSKTMATPPPAKFNILASHQLINLQPRFVTSTSTEPNPAAAQSVHNVIVMDGNTPLRYPYPPGVAFNLLHADLQASTRFKLVSSIKDADLVVDIDGSQYWQPDAHDPRSTPLDPEVDFVIMDPKTLQPLWLIKGTTPVRGTLGMVLHPDKLSKPSAKEDKLPDTIQSMITVLATQTSAHP